MSDTVDAATRSRIMSRITKKWSQIDRKTHNFLKSSKVRHAMYPKLAGSPDILIYPNILVFLDGCFWHCCPKCFRPPKSRIAYWHPKLAGNKRRDARISRALKKEGWKVIRIWEHKIRAKPKEILRRICETRSHALARRSAAPPSSAVAPISTRRRLR
jgi:DNA mismatch endonuclease, patch repair protein